MSPISIHLPWLKSIIKVFGSCFILLAIHYFLTGFLPVLDVPAIICAIIYTHIFKYFWHRYPMHKRIIQASSSFVNLNLLVRFFASIKRSHSSHHADFYGANYHSLDADKLNNIVSEIYVFPSLLLAHYLVALAVSAPIIYGWLGADWIFDLLVVTAIILLLFSVGFVVAGILDWLSGKYMLPHLDLGMHDSLMRIGLRLFAAGSTLLLFMTFVLALSWSSVATFFTTLSIWFFLFESTHWFSHVKDNFVDRIFRRIRLVGYIWVFMVEFHRDHHDRPNMCFNFMYPAVGDRLFSTFHKPEIHWDKMTGEYRRFKDGNK